MITKRNEGKWVEGAISGISAHFQNNESNEFINAITRVTTLRLLTIFFAFFYGLGIIIYVALTIFMPRDPSISGEAKQQATHDPQRSSVLEEREKQRRAREIKKGEEHKKK